MAHARPFRLVRVFNWHCTCTMSRRLRPQCVGRRAVATAIARTYLIAARRFRRISPNRATALRLIHVRRERWIARGRPLSNIKHCRRLPAVSQSRWRSS